MLIKLSGQTKRRIAKGLIVTMTAHSAIPPALAIEASPETTIDRFLTGQEIVDTRLSDLGTSMSVLQAQMEALSQMVAQSVAAQHADQKAVAATIDEQRKTAEVEREKLKKQVDSLDAAAKKDPLANDLKKTLTDLQALLPKDTKPETLKTHDFRRTQEQLPDLQRAADKALQQYIEGRLAPSIREKCKGISEQTHTEILNSATNLEGKPLSEEALGEHGCNQVATLVTELAQARTAEQAQQAFMNSMQNMMTMAMMSGNPYVVAIAAVIMLLAAILGGKGEGEGEGEGSQPNKPIKDTAKTTTTSETQAPAPTVNTPPAPVINSESKINTIAGKGCEIKINSNGQTLVLRNQNPQKEELKELEFKLPFPDDKSLPNRWQDKTVTFTKCDFSTGMIAIKHSPSNSKEACYWISNAFGKLNVVDAGFNTNSPCSK